MLARQETASFDHAGELMKGKMSDQTKKVLVASVVGSLVGACLTPDYFCGPNEICAIDNPEAWHTREREPGPTDTVFSEMAPTSTAVTLRTNPATWTSSGEQGPFKITLPIVK